MSVNRDELLLYLNTCLQPQHWEDYGPNGLQVSGKSQIKKIITGVTASQALIDQAVIHQADVLLVHHGLFWAGDNYALVGMKYQRLKPLFDNNINLLAYHLPLDAHPVWGNNIQLANRLNLKFERNFTIGKYPNLGLIGRLAQALSGKAFAEHISSCLNRTALYISGHQKLISRVALCTGGAQKYIEAAFETGADAYITGEASEQTVHIARELGIDFYAAGHHATERYGVKALGEHLSEHFNITHEFIDIDNPV